jgi:hypothetical protein
VPFHIFLLRLLVQAHVAYAVRGLFKVESPFDKPVEGMQLCVSNMTAGCVSDTVSTDSSGHAVLTLEPNKAFVVRGVKQPEYQDLFIFGVSGSSDFNYTTYMGTREEARVLARLIHRPYNFSLGYIVVGMDIRVNGELEPAIGASANISGISGGKPFIYNGIRPEDGRTVIPSGTSFVTWPDMSPGENGQVSVLPPLGMGCTVLPAGKQHLRVQAYPDSVSVVSYLCQQQKTAA